MENKFIENEFGLTPICQKGNQIPGLFLSLFILFISFSSFSPASFQDRICNLRDMDPAQTWILDTTVGKVKFYHTITQCGAKNAVLLKFENKNDYRVRINWKESFLTQQFAHYVDGFAGQKTLNIDKKETLYPSSCSDTKNKTCIILAEDVSPAYLANIINVYFKEISVTVID